MSSLLTHGAMLAVMLLHAGFGCCWHHAHAAHPGGEAIPHAHLSAITCHHHHHGHEDSPEGLPEAPCPQSDDCSGTCVFLKYGSPTVPDLETTQALAPFDNSVPASLLQPAAALTEARHSFLPEDAPPCARRPLLCVWLI